MDFDTKLTPEDVDLCKVGLGRVPGFIRDMKVREARDLDSRLSQEIARLNQLANHLMSVRNSIHREVRGDA